MRRKSLASLFVILLAAFCSAPALAAVGGEDSDTRMSDAMVVEVNEHHVSVIAKTGVEHVIAADDASTKVTREGKVISLKDLRKGDVVTVELDAANPLKFARHITISERANSEVAHAKP